eukprot:g67856.t1
MMTASHSVIKKECVKLGNIGGGQQYGGYGGGQQYGGYGGIQQMPQQFPPPPPPAQPVAQQVVVQPQPDQSVLPQYFQSQPNQAAPQSQRNQAPQFNLQPQQAVVASIHANNGELAAFLASSSQQANAFLAHSKHKITLICNTLQRGNNICA